MNFDMPSSRACVECLYWHVTKLPAGECRVNPPHLDARWPHVGAKDWCGRFEPVAYLNSPSATRLQPMASAPSGVMPEAEAGTIQARPDDGPSKMESDDERFLALVQKAAPKEAEALSFRDLYSQIKKDTPLDLAGAYDVLQALVTQGRVKETRDGFWAPARIRPKVK